MFRLIKKGILFSIGMQEKARELAEEFIDRGEKSERRSAKLIKEMVEKSEKSIGDIKEKVSEFACRGVEKANIPTKSDLDRLEKGLKDLSARLSRVETHGQARGTD